MIHFGCPSCGKSFQFKEEDAGRRTKCPKCGHTFQVPQLAPTPPSATGGQSFEFAPSSRPHELRPIRVGLFIGLGAGFFVLVIGTTVVALWASGVFSKSDSIQTQGSIAKASDPKTRNQSPSTVPKPQKLPQENKGTGESKDQFKKTDEAKKKDLAQKESEQKKKEFAQAIQNATAFQAPPGGKGNLLNADSFLQSLRELAGNEFKFRQGREVVYRSTFDQKDQSQVVSWYLARNAILDPGKYDFAGKVYTVPLHFYFWHYKKSTGLEGKVLPETTDYVSVLAKIEMDQDTAAKMRDAFDKRMLSLTVWYRLRSVLTASWEPSAHWTDGRLAHAISFDTEVLKFEFALDGR